MEDIVSIVSIRYERGLRCGAVYYPLFEPLLWKIFNWYHLNQSDRQVSNCGQSNNMPLVKLRYTCIDALLHIFHGVPKPIPGAPTAHSLRRGN